MKKIRVLFPYVEAGYGHIMPLRSIEESFSKKYGDRVEVVSSQFFTETGDVHLIRYEKMISRQVRNYNRFPALGYLATGSCEFFGTFLSSFGSMQLTAPVAWKRGVEHMRALSPDIVFSTHWATNFYAMHLEKRPYTVMYCPDAQYNKLFEYDCDLSLISMPYGYEKALRKKRFNISNLKMVPFFIRNEAFGVSTDQRTVRRELGLPEDRFTVILAEGGYGIGKMEAICRLLSKEHIPLTVIPVCGKNEKLLRKLSSLEHTPEVDIRPHGFTDDILKLEAAADLFCGKSGNILAEATFFGVPTIVTKFATLIERNIADHYINTVGCAIKEFSPKKVVRLISSFVSDPSLLDPYRDAARAYHDHFGSGQAADLLWETIVRLYPALKDGEPPERAAE